MVKFFTQNQAFGAPGIEPRWTQSNKVGIGTAYCVSSQIWFTVWNGTITEVYYPTIDRPQIQDLQYLITHGKSFFHEEKRHLESKTEQLWNQGLGYQITNSDPDGRYAIIKEAIDYVDIPNSNDLQAIKFTFFWVNGNSWEPRNYTVSIKE